MILGIRPQDSEDASLLSDEKRQRGQTFKATIDVTEWLGNELYAYVPLRGAGGGHTAVARARA